MARKRMVRRTYKKVKVTTLNLNIETAEPYNETYELIVIDNKKDIISLLKAEHETDTEKIVSVISSEEGTVLYGMDEESYIKNAEVLADSFDSSDTGDVDDTGMLMIPSNTKLNKGE